MKKVLGQTLFDLMRQDSRIVLLLCDVAFPDSDKISKAYPDRMYDFGLTEQTTTGIAAGMASQGLRPVFYTISPFLLERCFEFIKIDIDHNNLPVMMIGYDYEDYYGPTHSCLDAKTTLSMFKNIVSYFPQTVEDAKWALVDAYVSNKPSFILLKRCI